MLKNFFKKMKNAWKLIAKKKKSVKQTLNEKLKVQDYFELIKIIVANNAVERILNGDIPKLKRSVPATLDFEVNAGNPSLKKDIRRKMFMHRGSKPLMDSGALLRSLEPSEIQATITNETMELSSALPYAKKHLKGGQHKAVINPMWESKYDVSFYEPPIIDITPREFMKYGDVEKKQLQKVIKAKRKK